VSERGIFRKVDYTLLITFVFFFVLVGNISRIEPVRETIFTLLTDRELLVSALVSQFVSNVPAAAMLASFTENARGLILGTNIGGLGTLIASMASLISYRQIVSSGISRGRYLLIFSIANFSLLALLLAVYGFVLL